MARAGEANALDILEQGGDDPPERSPLRRRAPVVLVALALGVLAVIRYQPTDRPTPTPVAESTTADSTTADSTTAAPTLTDTPVPTPKSATTPPTLGDSGFIDCTTFLDSFTVPDLTPWGATQTGSERIANLRVFTFTRHGGTISIAAGCGPIKWELPLGTPPDSGQFVTAGSTSTRNGGPHPALAVWMA
ncbi:MAG: hypothetical protein QOI42_1333, partial [Frankiaceae bacterium]|nr:hypothetical protein [Frankiaceae bacterium]